MTAPLTTAEVLQLRMRAQLLRHISHNPDPGPRSGAQHIAAVTRHMLALQGQDWPSSRWAVGVRTPGTGVADVHAAFDEGLLVRSWPMRSTVHVVAAEDIAWMQALTSERVLRGAAKRREFLGLSDATLERVVEVSIAALANGARLTRDELSAAWTAAGIEWRSNWRYHLVWWLCQTGVAVLGPVSREGIEPADLSGEPLIVLADDWIRAPKRLDGDEALAEFAARYAAARGPVTAKDLAWWSGLTMGDSKRGLALATEAGALQQVAVAHRPAPHWVAADVLDTPVAAGEHAGLLLPAFDEHLLGYTDRAPQLDPAHFEHIVPGRNGMFRATVVADGIVQGVWRRDGAAKAGAEAGRIVATPMPGCVIRSEELAEPAAQWTQFHGYLEANVEIA